ncbi:1483_t:CDS:2 [Acaulospora morrowiae]|uniref:1483_t:CDS:1 n=1 Tax=Acaulospora morrowiae TaxID=94023 RepID=A0A9N9F9Z4_9GLOM|nr:1483_t:CDS:2 [Acaulospora morrowiae]
MAAHTNSFVRTFSNVSRASARSKTTSDSVDVVQNRMPEHHYYRTLWWEKGDFHQKANWKEATLPYTLAVGVTLDEYERRSDKFNVRGYWEWVDYKVIIYELPSKPHETLIGAIISEIVEKCLPVKRTDASIGNLGAIRTRADNSGKEADACFRPSKPRVRPPNGCDEQDEPWPNLVVEVAHSESEEHVLEKVKDYWLGNLSRVHDAIVVKIGEAPLGQPPLWMQAWHFCVSDRPRRTADIQPRTYFEFGTHDQYGNPTNIIPGQCVINISLDCLYHDAFPRITIHRQLLPDSIVFDFLLIRDEFLPHLEKNLLETEINVSSASQPKKDLPKA